MDSIEKPQAGALDISVVTTELGVRATELLLLRAYAQQLSEAFDQQQEVIAVLRAEVAQLRGESASSEAAPVGPSKERFAHAIPWQAGTG